MRLSKRNRLVMHVLGCVLLYFHGHLIGSQMNIFHGYAILILSYLNHVLLRSYLGSNGRYFGEHQKSVSPKEVQLRKSLNRPQ